MLCVCLVVQLSYIEFVVSGYFLKILGVGFGAAVTLVLIYYLQRLYPIHITRSSLAGGNFISSSVSTGNCSIYCLPLFCFFFFEPGLGIFLKHMQISTQKKTKRIPLHTTSIYLSIQLPSFWSSTHKCCHIPKFYSVSSIQGNYWIIFWFPFLLCDLEIASS